MNFKNVAAFGAMAAVMGVAGAAQAETVTVNGSTTVLPAMQLVAEDFMKANPNVTVTISGTGSGNGIKALMDGTTEVAMASRDLKTKEADDLKAHGHAAVKFVVAYDAIIPVVNTKNAVKSLTMEQLRDVYSGKIKDWKELGGAAAPIVVVGRDTSSGTHECFQELVMGKTRVSKRALLQSSNGGVVQAVAGNPNAIGYIGVGYMSKETQALAINGVQPGLESAKNKTWPISRDLFLFTAGEPSGNAKKLIDYMLSPEGQKNVEKAGFVPVPEAK